VPVSSKELIGALKRKGFTESTGTLRDARYPPLIIIRPHGFGAGLSRAIAMRVLGPGALPGRRPSEVTFASNQVCMGLPHDAKERVGAHAGGRGEAVARARGIE